MVTKGEIIFDTKGSYMVISKDILPSTYTDYTFIAHMEGNPKGLARLWKEHKDVFSGHIYFCTKEINFFSNHYKEVEEGLYEYTGSY